VTDHKNWAKPERAALSDLLVETGPDAPTLCDGWTTGDLAAHLVVREYRPDAGPGIMLPPLAGYTERVQRRARTTLPYGQLVDKFRHGPPKLSLWGVPGMDAAGNSIEYFVHHEDVRRARQGWQPRTLDPAQEETLWRRLGMSRMVLRRLPVQITLVRPDGQSLQVTKGGKRVSVHGPVGELVLWTLGRTGVAQVRMTGEAEAIDILNDSRWRL
jgi:uncharacterized protein (TIGR03085 family)